MTAPIQSQQICKSPLLSESQLSFRIGLLRKRTASYPLDTLDFIMMDLERPDLCSREAHWCTGDLTGRLLECLSCAEGVDGKHDPRLSELFERILRQRRPSGLFGRYAPQPINAAPEDVPTSGCDRLFSGFVRYYELTGDWRALDAATGIAEHLFSIKDKWASWLEGWTSWIEGVKGNPIEAWISEPLARLYNITRDQRYLDFLAIINENIRPCEGSHSHGFMSIMRGLQLAAIYTGDSSWNEKPEFNRRKIIDNHYEMADGGVAEFFPRWHRNEGCSIADWLMMNLYSARISGSAEPHEKAENILWNALFLNQLITGGFGLRDLIPSGYMTGLSEAWWCCTENCGMAMTEFAKHAVTLDSHIIKINHLIPGKFVLSVLNGPDIEVHINTNFPTSADTVVNVRKLPQGFDVDLRVPSCIANAAVDKTQDAGEAKVTLKGKIGHWTQDYQGGVVLKYGPLVLAPSAYYWDVRKEEHAAGYSPISLPKGIPQILCGQPDSDGFISLSSTPIPDWSQYDEGPGARLCVGNAAVNVPLQFDSGEVKTLRFWPLCYNTSTLNVYETPILFKGTLRT